MHSIGLRATRGPHAIDRYDGTAWRPAHMHSIGLRATRGPHAIGRPTSTDRQPACMQHQNAWARWSANEAGAFVVGSHLKPHTHAQRLIIPI